MTTTMTSQALNGNVIAAAIQAEVAQDVQQLHLQGIQPGLTVVLVGNHPASEVYVRNKVRTSAALGIKSESITPPATVTTEEMLTLIAQLNAREDVDGILIQLPLPAHVDAKRLLEAISPEKDVDGFHPVNVGRLVAVAPGRPSLAPCTPAGIIQMLKRSGIAIAGQHAVVVGRSDIVGKPMAMLLLHENATVTICHSKTRDLAAFCRSADILVAAIGKAGIVSPQMVRPGAVLVDVGMNRITSQEDFERFFSGNAKREATFREKGSVLMGDIDPHAFALASYYTPVPGGVGPLTIAMLMVNTVRAARLRRGLPT
ncbi:MAG: bifunctional 5,10-methylenetetrahydrofolate dehydrogenase/5,10-methenyltetrahydrofolate cyclohydrolase [Acidobacteriaceae bacterium]